MQSGAASRPRRNPFFMNRHSLKIRFIGVTVLLYAFIGVVSLLAFKLVTDRVIGHLGTRFAVKQALLEKSKLNASIQRDLALSLRLATSPLLMRWIAAENDPAAKGLAVEELENYRRSFSDKSVFVAVNSSGHYYFSNGSKGVLLSEPRYTLKRANPNDAWYFRTMREVGDFELNVDYDNHLDLTKVWFNVVIRDRDGKKAGLCGSGIDLTSFVRDIVDSNEDGIETILLASDGSITGHHDRSYVMHNSKVRGAQKKFTIYDLLPGEADRDRLREAIRALSQDGSEVATSRIDMGGKTYLAAMTHLKDIGWFNLVLLDTNQVVGFRTFLPILLIFPVALFLLIVGIGLLVNRMVLAPLARLAGSAEELASGNFHVRTGLESKDEMGALSRSFDSMAETVREHSENLERLVRERTEQLDRSHRELAESNGKLMDSIRYAEMIQKSILPAEEALRNRVRELVLFYRPRDIVGGDFYYFRDCGASFLVAVADCTGHGVPGAFMCMTAKALLDRSVAALGCDRPAELLAELDRLLKEALHQGDGDTRVDNGLEIGICLCSPERRRLVFAGAGIDLLQIVNGGLRTVPGSRQPIGYRRTAEGLGREEVELPLEDGMAFYMTTDGILDQAGGARGWGFGRKRLAELLERIHPLGASEQLRAVETELSDYQGDLPQRDDITILGFRI